MNPDVLAAVFRLRRQDLLSDPLRDHLVRVAKDELVSVHLELRLAFYLGVLLFTSGIGLLLKEHFERIGPLEIALGIALLGILASAWIAGHAPPFSWGETPANHPAFDYILLLAAGLFAADLAYIEVQFTPLGPHWPWHLLLISTAAGLASLRYDSRILFSFALSNFCAWCGASLSWTSHILKHGNPFEDPLYRNALGCGILFLLLGRLLLRTRGKPHFEPVATYLGWILILSTLISGISPSTDEGIIFTFLLLATGLGLTFSLRFRRFPLFAMGCISAYVALCAFFHRFQAGDTVVLLWYLTTSLGLLVLLLLIHRRFQEDA